MKPFALTAVVLTLAASAVADAQTRPRPIDLRARVHLGGWHVSSRIERLRRLRHHS